QPVTPDWAGVTFSSIHDVSQPRLLARRQLLTEFETRLKQQGQGTRWEAYGQRQLQALDLLTEPRAREAADLSREPAALRDRYGRTPFGNSVLLARRFVEAGVRLVQVNWYRGPEEPS
ncbi:MAG: DUF1501 domain-containing protein, partial [Planctomycetaceae bacterium]